MTETSPAPAKRQRRKRRSTEEIVERILAAASEEFEDNGYAGATTARIAKKAGVAEAPIFGNFGSKANLFQASIFQPLSKHLVEFCDTHLVRPGDPQQARTALRSEYITELQHFIQKHHRKFISLFFAEMYGDGEAGLNKVGGIQAYFDKASDIEIRNADKQYIIDPRIIARLSFAAIFSGIVLKDWLFPDGMIDDDEISSSLTAFVIDGLNVNHRA